MAVESSREENGEQKVVCRVLQCSVPIRFISAFLVL